MTTGTFSPCRAAVLAGLGGVLACGPSGSSAGASGGSTASGGSLSPSTGGAPASGGASGGQVSSGGLGNGGMPGTATGGSLTSGGMPAATAGAGSSGNGVGGSVPATTGGTVAVGTGGTAVSTGGSVNPQGGVGGFGTTGGAGAAGAASGASGAGNGGATSDDTAAARVLNGYAMLKPCVSSFKPTPNPDGNCCCEELPDYENRHETKTFEGDPNVTYQVKLRIAGIAERYWYSGGNLDSVGKLFYTGGLPTIHSTQAPNSNLKPGAGACKIHPPETDATMALPFKVPVEINPSDGCFNGFNIFAMTVSAPKQSYYLNYTSDFDGSDRQPHKVYKNDYTVTIPIRGGATLDFYTIDGDHHQVTNDGTMTVPSVKTAQPYNGNFLEFTVVSVTRAN